MVMLGTDMKVAETPKEGLKDYIKVDPYTEWLKKEGVRVYEEYYFPSLAKIELGPWERKGGSGAVVHIKQQPHAQRLPRRRDQTRRQVRARASHVRADDLRGVRTRRDDDLARREAKAELRVAGREPIFHSAQLLVPELQRQRPGAGALHRRHQRAADDAAVPRQ